MKRIDIAKLINSEVATREAISEVKRRIRADQPAVLDFSKITFISRSFADELLHLREENPQIEFENLADPVSEMMEVVEKQHREEIEKPRVKFPRPVILNQRIAKSF